MKITFIINANKYSGGGHIYRCLKLINRLSDEKYDVSVVTLDIDKIYVDLLLGLGISIVDKIHKSDYIFCDHYELNISDYKKLSKTCKYLVVMDDLCNRPIYADYLWDPNPLRSELEYANYVNDSAKLFLGGKYAFFDKFTKDYYYLNKQHTHLSLHLYFGQGKQGELIQMYEYLKFFPHAIDTLSGDNLHLCPHESLRKDDHHYGFVSPFSFSLARTKLCLGSPGNALWERMLFGVPTLIVMTNENQREISEMLVANDFALLAPEDIDYGSRYFQDDLVKVFEDDNKLNRISKKISKCFDINGIDNFLNEVGLI